MMGAVVSAAAFRRLKLDHDIQKARADNLEAALRGLEDTKEAMALGLTPTEFRIYSVLRRHEAASTEAILMALYSDKPDGGSDYNIVSVYIHKLRRKLEGNGYRIESRHGVGYRLVRAEGGEA
ncbi:helix-turn-helix domain-containing protein [Martelella mangrovi]|uniref:DNA-binding response OmpR family regulator n=1 Tax=Martelella mangrovi TaxID=1397477 RepID=A0ABV2IGV1_9HYPH